MSKIRNSEIIKGFGKMWVVSKFGIENRQYAYSIPARKLGKDWRTRMQSKDWVCLYDFQNALIFAREYFHVEKGK